MGTNKVAVIGLGLMGSRLSMRLLDAGFDVHGYDTSTKSIAEFEKGGGIPAGSPSEAVSGCWGVVLSLPDSNVSRDVCLGRHGIADAGASPLYVYDTTTGSPQDAVAISEAMAESGVTYSDSTLSGNSETAERGQLVVMVGGTAEAYDMGQPIFDSIGRSHHHVGGPGSGSVMKLIVNHVLMIHRMALGEGLVVAELSDLDLPTTLDVLRDSLAYSKAMDTWGDRMVAGDHENPFSRVRQSHKDSRLIVDHAQDLGAPIDLVSVVQAALAEAESDNLGELDNSAVIEVVRRRAGVGRVTASSSSVDDQGSTDRGSDSVSRKESTYRG